MTQLEMERRIKELEKENLRNKECISRTLDLISKNADQILELN